MVTLVPVPRGEVKEMRLKVSYDRRTDGLIVRLSGEVDLSVEEHLSVLLEEAMAGQPPPPAVVVDLSGLRFLDCAGVLVLLRGPASRERPRLRLERL